MEDSRRFGMCYWAMEDSRRCSKRNLKDLDPESMQNCIEELVQSATADSVFFKSNPPKQLPRFEHKEIETGDLLGKGEFGAVREVVRIRQGRGMALEKLLLSDSSIRNLNLNNNVMNSSESVTDDKIINQSSDESIKDIMAARTAVQKRCRRDGKARFAVKRLRDDLDEAGGEEQFSGVLDFAMEAKFLASLNHPNVVKLRGYVGTPGRRDFMLVLDRLYLTLSQQIALWKATENSSSLLGCGGGAFRLFEWPGSSSSSSSSGQPPVTFIDRLYAMFDIARAMKFFHENNIIHRDLKPENIAYDIRGDLRVYDLGLAREVKKEDLIRPPEDYLLSALIGSIRWMAPEVRCSLPYGPSADVYSFGLIFWNIFSLKTPYGKISVKKHFKNVVQLGERPSVLKFLPSQLDEMMTQCWDVDRSKRPSFEKICSVIQCTIKEMEGGDSSCHGDLLDRTGYLKDKSATSLLDFVA